MTVKRILHAILPLLLALNLLTFTCYASENVAVSQAYVCENVIDVFTQSEFRKDDLSIKISNQSGIVKNCGSIAGAELQIYTTILVDVSTSVPTEARDKIIEVINYLIENLNTNEQFRIATFGEQLEILQDFTSDRYDLANGAKKIEFSALKSMIYDAVYNTIPQIQPVDGKPCFYRTVVISDGVDVASSGITKEELFLKLQDESYPVNVIAVSKEQPKEPKKDLSALARISGGVYSDLVPDSDSSAISDSINAENIFWIEAEVPSQLLDGSIRQVDITDGSASLQFDIKVPVFDMPSEEVSLEPPEPAPVVTEPASSESADGSAAAVDSVNIKILIIAAAAAAAVILLAAVFLVIIKASKHSGKEKTAQNVRTVPNRGVDNKEEKTEFISSAYNGGACCIIKLSSLRNPSGGWTIPVEGEVLIGRSSDCAVCLDDKSVSREQCKIVNDGQGLALVNLSQTNRTLLNGRDIDGTVKLNPGDSLKFGREVLRVDYIQSVGKSPDRIEPVEQNRKSDTESLF